MIVRTVPSAARRAALRETTGERLRRLRLARGWSQHALALAAGTTQPTVSDIERDAREVYAATLDRLASALGIGLQALWSGEATA